MLDTKLGSIGKGMPGVTLQVLADAGRALGTAVATMAMILDVDLYVIGGSVVKAGDLLLEPARVEVRLRLFQTETLLQVDDDFGRIDGGSDVLEDVIGFFANCRWSRERD